MGRLTGKAALVTGASRGLGADIARALAREGARVVVNYRTRRDRADDVVVSIRAAGGEAIAMQADCTDEAQVAALVDAALAAFGEIRILVNNSGILSRHTIADMPLAAWEEMMASHLRAHFLVTRCCLARSMLALQPLPGERIAAKIINMGSGLVNRGGLSARGQVHYMTAKAGVAGFTRGLAAEVAPHITVNALAPGIHMTDMVGSPDAATRAAMAGYFLLGLPEDRDVAATTVFLASSDADHITGEIVTINGGSA